MNANGLPNISFYDNSGVENRKAIDARAAYCYSHGGTVEVGRWKDATDSWGNKYQRRTIRAVDASGRVVELICFRD